MCQESGSGDAVVVHLEYLVSKLGIKSQKHFNFAHPVSKLVHFDHKITVSLRDTIQITILDANSNISVFFGFGYKRRRSPFDPELS